MNHCLGCPAQERGLVACWSSSKSPSFHGPFRTKASLSFGTVTEVFITLWDTVIFLKFSVIHVYSDRHHHSSNLRSGMLSPSQIPILVSALPSLLTLLLPSFIFKRMGEWEYGGAVVLEKTLESPLDCKEIQPVDLKGNQSWIFIGRTDVGAEALVLWPPDAKNWLIGKDADGGKDWKQEDKGTIEDEMTQWTWAWADSERQGSLPCCSPWGCRVRHN